MLSQNLQAQAFTRNVINVCHLLSYVCLSQGREGFLELVTWDWGCWDSPDCLFGKQDAVRTLAKAAAAQKPLEDSVRSRKSSI